MKVERFHSGSIVAPTCIADVPAIVSRDYVVTRDVYERMHRASLAVLRPYSPEVIVHVRSDLLRKPQITRTKT